MNEWRVPKLLLWISVVVMLMLGLNNIDSMFSGFLQHQSCAEGMYAQSLAISSLQPYVLYHISFLMVMFSMLIMTAMFLFEFFKRDDKRGDKHYDNS